VLAPATISHPTRKSGARAEAGGRAFMAAMREFSCGIYVYIYYIYMYIRIYDVCVHVLTYVCIHTHIHARTEAGGRAFIAAMREYSCGIYVYIYILYMYIHMYDVYVHM